MQSKSSSLRRKPEPYSDPIVVLILDDAATDREIFRRLLKNAFPQYVVHEASTIEAGRALLKKLKVDCVLLDLSFPEDTGYSLLKELTDAPIYRCPPVIILTDLSADHLKVSAEALGASAYLVKSRVDGPILDKAVREAIHNTEEL